MAYEGPDRRVHAVFSTVNREYHVRAGICVAVREKKTGVWMSMHEAIGGVLDEGSSGDDYIGESLHFLCDQKHVLTTRVVDVQRPELPVVNAYEYVWSVSPESGVFRVPKTA